MQLDRSLFFEKRKNKEILLTSAKEAGLYVGLIDGSQVKSDDDLFQFLSKVFIFPDYFGFNWDALDECLVDLNWIDSKGFVILIDKADVLWKEATSVAVKLAMASQDAMEIWEREEKPFKLIFLV